MPITPYVRPQETITQILRMTPAPSVNRRNPLVIGPEYLLGNYDATSRYETAYDALIATLDYTYLDADGVATALDTDVYTVDQASVKVYAEDIEVKVSGASPVAGRRGTLSTVITRAAGITDDFFTGTELVANMNGRSLAIGDILYITSDAVVYRRTIVGFTKDSLGQATEILLNGVVPGAPADVVTFIAATKFSGALDTDVLTALSAADIVVGATDVTIDQLVFESAVMGTTADCNSIVSDATTPGALGNLSVNFRAVRNVGELESVITINSLTDLAQLGELHLDNWAAYGAYNAFKGNQSSKTYVLRTGGDTVEHFTAALAKIRSTDYYYAIAPMTDLDAVKELVAAHCDELSNKYNRNFRRCYVGTETPSAFRIWDVKSTGDLRLATVDGDNNRIIIDEDDQSISNFITDLSVGDIVTLGATTTDSVIDEGTGTEVVISRIISATEVEFTGTYANGAGETLYATRKDSAENVVKYFSERSIGSRRCVNVWSDAPVTFGATTTSVNSVRMPLKFVAAEIAGLRCALLPQQGLTMTELLSIDAAPGMYTRFTPEQLDAIASNGVMIANQEIEGGEVFIRHQLTTDTANGALAYEDNVGVIVDDFSYRVKDAFRSYLGRRNVTQETIAEINAKLKELAIAATQESIANREIGPMVLRFFDEDDKEGQVTVRVDGNLADHIVTFVRLRVPLPINGLDHFIDVETSVEL